MYNKVVFIGNLTRDIELKYTPTGVAVSSSGLAINRKYTHNGEKKSEVCFIDITFFNRSAEIANQYLKKGSKILVDGRLKLDSWVDNSGAKRSKHSVVVETMSMLDSRGDSDEFSSTGDFSTNNSSNNHSKSYENSSHNSEYNSSQNRNSEQGKPKEDDIPVVDLNEDEIPF